MAYTYKGTNRDITLPPLERKKRAAEFNPDMCGTTAGYNRHRKARNKICAPCLQAERERTGAKARQERALCGTKTGYSRHHREGTPPCQECREAKNTWQRENRAKKRIYGPIFIELQCGTITGKARHASRKEPPCQECKAARNAHNRARRKAEWRAIPGHYKQCGTYAGFSKHRRDDTAPCGPCLTANNVYTNELRARRRAAKAKDQAA